MSNRYLYVCIHIIQGMPISCMNRDDTGSPKYCIYGGVRRGRVSSQSWKQAVRKYMQDHYGDTGVRTRDLVEIVSQRLEDEFGCEGKEFRKYVRELLGGKGTAGLVSNKKDEKKKAEKVEKASEEKENKKDEKITESLAFFSRAQIDAICRDVADRYRKEHAGEKADHGFKEMVVRSAKEAPSVSQLLFGRMFSSNPSLNYDAACQVAHSFTVDEVQEQTDYFTAVDDIRMDAGANGSAHIGEKYYHTGVLYRYATVNLSQGTELRNESYDLNAAEATMQFIRSFALAMPSGSINSYANGTFPESIVVELREAPVSYAPAFMTPVSGPDICANAEERLDSYMAGCDRKYGGPVRRWDLRHASFDEICSDVQAEIGRRL